MMESFLGRRSENGVGDNATRMSVRDLVWFTKVLRLEYMRYQRGVKDFRRTPRSVGDQKRQVI